MALSVCLPRHRNGGAGGTRTHKHRLSRHVLRIGSQDVFKTNDRRSCDQRCTLLSHLSYTPEESSGGGGARTHNPRVKNHVLQSAVGHVLLATKVLVRGISVRESNPPTAMRSPDSLDGADVLRTGSRRCIQCPTKGCQEALLSNTAVRTSNLSRRLLTGPFVSERLQRHSLAGRPASLP